MSTSVVSRLETLHSSYVEAVNEAVAEDRPGAVRRLVAAYEQESERLLAEDEARRAA